ncbi:MAG: ATP-binding cassette domain-containing protein, partial [Gemmatimonadetes bacterium]|nr:ATP-binding cassette domain-containing protein [Gemmatimonadota bacterium]
MKLELEKLTKDYEGHRAVDGIDMTVEDGELVVFLGHSGCGKTTTLMMVAGLIAP